MKEVMIICQHFVPYTKSVGGVARVLSIAEEFINNNYKVHVITSDGVDYGYLGYEGIINKLDICYIHDPYKIKTQEGSEHNNRKRAATLINPKGLITFIKKIIKEFVIPDVGVFVINKYVQTAEEIIKKNEIRNVIVSSPPHSMQLVGLRLKQRNNSLNLIVDYRDSWNLTTIFKHSNWISNFISRGLEKKVLRICNHFTYASSPILSKIQDNYMLDMESKSKLILNGFNSYRKNLLANDSKGLSPCLKKQKSDKKKIGYFGMANDSEGYRNISGLIASFNKSLFLRENFSIEFYGHLDISSYKLDSLPFMKFHGNIPHQNVLDKMQEMDYLLLLHSDSKNSDEVITGKFYDYVQSGVGIICLSPFDMEARRLIQKYKLGIWVDIFDPNDMAKKLQSLSDSKQTRLQSADFDINNFSRHSQNRKFLEIVI